MKLLLVTGARPNYMKIAPLISAIYTHNQHHPRAIHYVLVHTGQHYDSQLFDVFFRDLHLPTPHYNLAIGSASPVAQTARLMSTLEPILEHEIPDLVMVVGDVNSTLASALTAAKMHIPVAHVEAGLRSFDRAMPEEINRILTDAISHYLFTTEQSATDNLLKEAIPNHRIFFVGNVMIDTLERSKHLLHSSRILSHLDLRPRSYALLTLHRPSNVDDKETLDRILIALSAIAQYIPVIFPCHPRTRAKIRRFGLQHYLSPTNQFRVIDPLGYLDFLRLMTKAQFVLTDSGGIQEETTILRIPCITLREQTERPITITAGTNLLAGTNTNKIVEHALALLNGHSKNCETPPLWDGKASARIINVLVNHVD